MPVAQLDATFAALADPTRRAIIARLARGAASVGELGEPFAISQPAVSKHLRVLEQAGLVTHTQQGQRRPRQLVGDPLRAATQWLVGYREFWTESFDQLDELLVELSTEPQARR